MTAPAQRLPLPASPGFRVAISPQRRRFGWRVWLLLGVSVAAAFILLIWSRIALDRSAFVLQEIEGRTQIAESQYWELRLEAARLQAPDRIIDAAVEMGMVYPATVRTIEVAGLGADGAGAGERWVDLKALLGAQP